MKARASVSAKPDHIAGCSGKERLASFAIADAAARRSRRNSGGGKSFQPYHCPHCGSWHIGNASAAMSRHRKNDLNKRRKAAFDEGRTT